MILPLDDKTDFASLVISSTLGNWRVVIFETFETETIQKCNKFLLQGSPAERCDFTASQPRITTNYFYIICHVGRHRIKLF